MKSSLLRNGFYNGVAGLVRIGLTILTIPALISLLGVKEYGLWVLVSAVVDIVALSGNGILVTTTVFVSRDLSSGDTKSLSTTLTLLFVGTLLVGILFAFLFWIGHEAIAGLFPQLEDAQRSIAIQAFKICGFVVWARLIQQVLIGIEQSYQQYGILNLLNTMQWILLSLGLLIVAWLGGRTLELIEWQAAAFTLMFVSHFWTVKRLVKNLNLQPIWSHKKFLAIAHHSLMNCLLSIGSVAFGRGDRLIVASYLGSESLVIYSAITDATSAMLNFASLPVQPIIPILSNSLVRTDANLPKLKQQIKKVFELNGLISLGFSVWLFTLAPTVMQFLLANAVSDLSIIAFRVAVVIYSLACLNAVGYYSLLTLAVNSCGIIHWVSVIFALFLIKIGAMNFGLLGAVLGNAGCLLNSLMLVLAMKKLNLSEWFWLKCLAFPLMWFLVSILISISTYNNFQIGIIIAIVETIILISWFFAVQKQTIKFISE